MDGIKILYSDRWLAVCIKPVGVLSEASETEENMPQPLSEYFTKARGNGYVGTVHRLDRNVGGVMIYSLNPAVTGKLSAMVSQRDFSKEYLAVLRGVPEKREDTLTDFLYHDTRINKTFTADKMRKGVKEASLEYKVLKTENKEDAKYSLVLIKLHTGRTHQIRAQFSSRGLPLCGDGKYGGGSGNPELWSYRISFTHPMTGKRLTFSAKPDEKTLSHCYIDTDCIINDN